MKYKGFVAKKLKIKMLTKLDSSGDAKLSNKTLTFTVSVPVKREERKISIYFVHETFIR